MAPNKTSRPPVRALDCGVLARLALFAQALLVFVALTVTPRRADAIPAFARKYGTSCQTCHTIFPKLSPFGEAFRRNGYRFPGVDSDFVKQEPIALGQEAYKKQFPNTVWPGTLPSSVPLSFGFLGQAVIHPDKNASAAIADNNANFTMKDLIAEAHIWTGGSFDDTTTFFGEVTFTNQTPVDIEHAVVIFNDLGGPHALNLRVGKSFTTLTSFGGHSTYVTDTLLPPIGATGLFGSTSDSWNVKGEYTGLEFSGVIGGRFDYSAGFNAGTNFNVKNTQSVYAHVGVKIGGLRLDGEGGGASDPLKPWAENALTLDTFIYRTASNYQAAILPNATSQTAPVYDDEILAYGGNLRGQLVSLELNAGAYAEHHSHATEDNAGVFAFTAYGELSYVIFPWLVPAIRAEYTRVNPQAGIEHTGTLLTNTRFLPGIAALVRPNIRLSLTGQFEHATGVFQGGGNWGAANGGAANVTDPTHPIVFETEAVNLGLWVAF